MNLNPSHGGAAVPALVARVWYKCIIQPKASATLTEAYRSGSTYIAEFVWPAAHQVSLPCQGKTSLLPPLCCLRGDSPNIRHPPAPTLSCQGMPSTVIYFIRWPTWFPQQAIQLNTYIKFWYCYDTEGNMIMLCSIRVYHLPLVSPPSTVQIWLPARNAALPSSYSLRSMINAHYC